VHAADMLEPDRTTIWSLGDSPATVQRRAIEGDGDTVIE
jgi:hypothetical protein